MRHWLNQRRRIRTGTGLHSARALALLLFIPPLVVAWLTSFPLSWDVPAFEGLSPSNETLAAQVEGLYYLLATATPVLVTSVEALAQCVFPQEELIAATFSLRPGQELPLSHLVDHLIQWGYRRVPLVDAEPVEGLELKGFSHAMTAHAVASVREAAPS